MRRPASADQFRPFPPDIAEYLHAFAKRRRRIALLKSAGFSVAVFFAGAIGACALDRAAPLPAYARWFLLLSDVAAAIAVTTRAFVRLKRLGDDSDATAERIEQLSPVFSQRLITVVSQLRMSTELRGSQAFLDPLVGDVGRDVAAAAPAATLLPVRLAAKPWAAAVAMAAVLAASFAWPWLGMPRLLERLFLPWADVPPVTVVRLLVAPGNARVRPGGNVVVTATVAPQDADPVLHETDDGHTWTAWPMTERGRAYDLSVGPLEQDARYYVTAGDAASAVFSIRVHR